MPGQKRTLSIFNFSRTQLKFLKYCLLFFLPIVVGYTILEILALNLPMNYKLFGNYLNTHSKSIQVMALGSSQMKNAFNPALSEKEAINFASTSQHHNEDFQILQQTRERLPNLQYILLEVSYNHLELPHHPSNYWKNSIYLKYYGVNAFDRTTYFNDKLVYLSNPEFYSLKLMKHYIYKTDNAKFNEYGFDTNNYDGAFTKLNYNEKEIASHSFRILNSKSLRIFKTNTAYLYKMLEYCRSENLKVIICTVPLYKTYLKERTPEIFHRRDSILQEIKKKYNNVSVLNEESDTLQFKVKDFVNENHLNPKGAKKFTELVNKMIDSLN